MKLQAFVLHNVSQDMFFRYDPRSSLLHHAHTFEVEADDIKRAADLIWVLTNVDSPNDLRINYPHLAEYAEQTVHYRQRENRSLSVGDVIVFYERGRPAGAYAVATSGFDELMGFDQVINFEIVSNDRPVSDARQAHIDFGLRMNSGRERIV